MNMCVMVGSKGRGSNLKAILEAWHVGDVPADLILVIAPKDGIPAIEIARDNFADLAILNPDRADYDFSLKKMLLDEEIDLICLAGYMRLLTPEIVQSFPKAILNIHPSLLPKFGGKGMYGIHVHEEVIKSGDKISGCSVHFVTERYDEGDVLLQKQCEVLEGDTPETLAQRVLELEHQAYPEAINLWWKKYYQSGRKASS